MIYSINGQKFDSDFLEHYGIKGQKWGVKHGPPYPLDDVVSARIRMNKKNYNRVESRELAANKEIKQSDAEHPHETLSQLRKQDGTKSRDELLSEINHPSDEDNFYDIGRHYNCPNCAAAFELTERGYDVIARKKENGANVENIESFFKNGKLSRVTGGLEFEKTAVPNVTVFGKKLKRVPISPNMWDEIGDSNVQEYIYDDLTKQIVNGGEGSRWVVVLGWDHARAGTRTSSFHAFNCKVENGEPVYYDTQSRRYCTKGRYINDDLAYADPREVYIMRCDNLELDESITNAVYSAPKKERK